VAAYYLTLLLATTSAITASTNVLEQINDLCTQLSLLSANHEPAEIYAELLDFEDPPGSNAWRAVPDRKTLDQITATTPPDTQAFVWRIDTGTLVAMLFESQSGDWVLHAEYCFDSAGALRRSIATFNSFHAIDPVTDRAAPVSRFRTTHFGADGHVVEDIIALRDLSTLEPAPHRQFMDHEDPKYLRLADLPFANLMPK
jgi:hypothetical protein